MQRVPMWLRHRPVWDFTLIFTKRKEGVPSAGERGSESRGQGRHTGDQSSLLGRCRDDAL